MGSEVSITRSCNGFSLDLCARTFLQCVLIPCMFSKSNSGHAPEAEFLAKITAIPGVSMVETQTITNMEI